MTLTLRSTQFRREREAAWRELERLVARAERGGVRALSAAELLRLPALYRGAVAALSAARTLSLDENLRAWLEALAARAYLVVHGVHASPGRALRRFLHPGLPQAVRRLRGPVLLSAALLLVGMLAGYGLVARDPEAYYALVPEGLAAGRTPAASTEALREGLYAGGSTGAAPFASFLFVNNARVGLLCFALGIVGGLPTLLLLLGNGLVLGAFVQVHVARGLALDVFGWLLPHGVPELTAVALCGGAGLALGRALWMPGTRTRTAALAEAGREACVLVLGALLLLALAGVLEGWFRQAVQDVAVRYAMAALATAAVGAWLLAPARAGSDA
ncbi:MAG: stage II sporulation protein M [Planctomycetia bacterium]